MVYSTVKIPRVLWAQRSDLVYVTFEVVEAQNEHIDITKDGLKFTAIQSSSGEQYAVELEFYAEVDAESLQQHKTDRCITVTIKKQDTEQTYWPRLLKTGKPHFVHTDFSRWKDEDEDEEVPPSFGGLGGMNGDFGNMDFSKFGGMGEGYDEEAESSNEEDEVDNDIHDDEDPYQKTSKEALLEDN